MARKPRPPGYRALRRRYGGELERLRAEYEAAAEGLARRARELESDYEIMARRFRHELAILKRKGLLPAATDLRRARPTSALSRALNDLYDVVTGERRAVRVSRKTAASLKEQGYDVTRGRVLLGRRHTLRGGEVHEREGVVRGTAGGRVRMLRLDTDIARLEHQVQRALGALGPNEYMGFDIGAGYSRLFHRSEFSELMLYLQGGGSFEPSGMKYLTIHRVEGSDALRYFRQREEETLARARQNQEVTRARRRQRRRQRRRVRQGLKRGIRTARRP